MMISQSNYDDFTVKFMFNDEFTVKLMFNDDFTVKFMFNDDFTQSNSCLKQVHR